MTLHVKKNGQTVLITGASGGVGAAIARRFAQKKMNIILHSHQSLDKVKLLQDECVSLGASTHVILADFRKISELYRIKSELDAINLYPDILINNAGVSHYGLVSDVSEEDWEQIISVNLKAAFFCSQIFSPYMIKQKYGRIVNISSIWGIIGASCEVLYSTSKGGLLSFTKALAKELAPSFVTVNSVAPGLVDTPMNQRFSTDELETIESKIPIGRMATPDEIAYIVEFLSSEESDYLTGQIISPNGGWVT